MTKIKSALLLLVFSIVGWSQAWQTVRSFRGTGVPAASMCNTGADLGIIYTDRNPNGATHVCRLNVVGGFTWYAVSTGSGMIYPGIGVPRSTGAAWGTSYAVGTAGNYLVQLNALGQLPAVSAALLTNFPTLNQSTSGKAATAGAADTAAALAADPANCTAGLLPRGIAASGAADGCAAVNLASEVTGILPAANVAVETGAPGPAGPIGPAGPAGSDGAAGVPGYSPNSLISGGGVVWTTGLTFTVSPASYYIANVQYSSPLSVITLDAADGALDRIDTIVVNSSGAVALIKGTAAAPPSPEVADPSTQLGLTFIYIAAKATVPSNVTADDIYHENTEWTTAKSGAPINLASTNNPHAGTVDIEATVAVTGNYVRFTGAAFDPASKNNLPFWIRSKAAWASTRSLQFQWYSTGTKKGSVVVLNEGAFGFVSSSTAAYQQIVIPMQLFAANGLSVNRLQINVVGSGAGIGFYLDDITMQTGIPAPVAPSGITWCGAWVAATNYPVNCQVLYGGVPYVAIVANVNSAPPSANWAALSTQGERYSWALCQGTPCVVGNDIANAVLVGRTVSLARCYGKAKVAPTGAALNITISRNGSDNVFSSDLTIADGSTAVATETGMSASAVLTAGEYLTVNITQVGSTIAGQDISVVCEGN